jgi:sugar/nucleoside kinase (ribokinase family)
MDEGVDITSCRYRGDIPTALCFITIDQVGDRSMVALGGAGPLESIDEFELDYLARARLIYLTDVKSPIIEIISDLALRQGIYLIVSPGGLISANGLSYCADLLPKADLWLLSRSEALDFLPEFSPEASPSILHKQGARRVVVTLGERGAAYAGPEGTFAQPAFPATRVLDTTGAGDAFAAGLMAGILSGKLIEESLRYANAAASLKIAHPGARSGLPSMADIDNLLMVGPAK